MRLHGADRTTEGRCRLGFGQVFEVPQYDDGALPSGQMNECASYRLAQIDLVVGVSNGQLFGEDTGRRLSAPFASPPRGVRRDHRLSHVGVDALPAFDAMPGE